MPAGSKPPDVMVPEKPAESKTYAGGKFKSPEDLERGYLDLEKGYGSQAHEVGQLRSDVKSLGGQIAAINAQAQKSATTPQGEKEADVLAASLADIQARVDSGDLSVGEALTTTSQLVAAHTATLVSTQAAKEMTNLKRQIDVDTAVSDWNKAHPDFAQLRDSGALDSIKKESALHDDMSAYLEYKGRINTAAAFEAGKAEAAKLAQGAEETKTVLNRPGGEAAQISEGEKKTFSPAEMREGAMGALRKARGGS